MRLAIGPCCEEEVHWIVSIVILLSINKNVPLDDASDVHISIVQFHLFQFVVSGELLPKLFKSDVAL